MTETVFEPDYLAHFQPDLVFQALLQTAYGQNCAFAAWRLPLEEQVYISISYLPEQTEPDFKLESAPIGFVFHPFQVSEKNPAYFLKSDLFFSLKPAVSGVQLNVITEGAEADRFLTKLNTVLNSPDVFSAAPYWFLNPNSTNSLTQPEFEELVQNGIGFMEKGGAEKVVLSRTEQENLPESFSPTSAFLKLSEQYSHAFISLVSVPKTGTWLGASPEILVQKDAGNLFRTMALAGTQKLENGLLPSEAIWRQKEIEEQSNVVRYVISCFKKLRLRDYLETGPRTVVAGNIMHLKTEFCVNLSENPDFPELTTDMLHLLHPTSAVCGQPKEAALDFIWNYESYDRRYYSGYLGPVNVNQETHIYVNLRCLELQAGKAVIYAGAGIMPDSNPEKEWQETELKMQTVKAALNL